MEVSGIPYIQGRNSYSDADGTKYGIAIHNTSNNATAEAEASYATRRTDGVSAHFFVDADSVIQSLDTAARAGHAGSSEGNQNAVAVEITGTNDKSRQWWLDNVAWDLLGRVLADVCRAYGIPVRRCTVAEMKANPRVRGFYSHDDMRRAWGGTTHTDPGPNFPWDLLFAAVNKYMEDDVSAVDVWDADVVPAQGLTPGNDFWQAKAALGYAMGQARAAVLNTERIRAELAAAEAREVARDAAQTKMLEGLLAAAGTGLTAEQLAALTAEVSRAAREAGDRVLARLVAAGEALAGGQASA